jgi:putative endonuclease
VARPPHLATGRWAEQAAEAFLQTHGLQPVDRNFRCRAGEIDLVMTDANVLVFVEVRFRRDQRFGGGLESVTPAKQRKLMAAAGAYLARHRAGGASCRFDVLSVSKRNYRPDFVWVKNAFGQDH